MSILICRIPSDVFYFIGNCVSYKAKMILCPCKLFGFAEMHMGVNKAIGFFLPPDVKFELAVNYGAVAAKPLCSKCDVEVN